MKTIKNFIFVAIGVLLCISGCGSSQADKAATKKKTVASQNKNSLPKIGITVDDGKMVYKVNKMHTASQVGPNSQGGPSSLPLKAKGKFVVINITVRNKGDDTIFLNDSFLN